jgi:hypothetical protein
VFPSLSPSLVGILSPFLLPSPILQSFDFTRTLNHFALLQVLRMVLLASMVRLHPRFTFHAPPFRLLLFPSFSRALSPILGWVALPFGEENVAGEGGQVGASCIVLQPQENSRGKKLFDEGGGETHHFSFQRSSVDSVYSLVQDHWPLVQLSLKPVRPFFSVPSLLLHLPPFIFPCVLPSFSFFSLTYPPLSASAGPSSASLVASTTLRQGLALLVDLYFAALVADFFSCLLPLPSLPLPAVPRSVISSSRLPHMSLPSTFHFVASPLPLHFPPSPDSLPLPRLIILLIFLRIAAGSSGVFPSCLLPLSAFPFLSLLSLLLRLLLCPVPRLRTGGSSRQGKRMWPEKTEEW